MMIPIEGHRNLFRDEKSGAIINTDNAEYNQYMKAKSEKLKQKNEIQNIKNEIFEIKQLLMELLNETRGS